MDDEEVHRRTMKRFEIAGHARYLTFSCYRRLPLLDHDGIRALFVKRLKTVCATGPTRLLGWVIMPEHVHLVVFPEAAPDLTRFTHCLKRPLAEAVLRRWKKLEAPILTKITHGDGYRYWQTGGGYDRNLFNPDEIREKITYMHNNPVRRGLATRAEEYAWSSARWYAGLADFKIECGKPAW